jgi:pimeloyl-ACP methyl ester carboxylesterase
MFEAGDTAAAIDGFLRAACGPEYRAAFDKTVPDGWFEQAVADADALFRKDLPSLGQWTFTDALARRITQPVLAVVGTESGPVFHEGHGLIKQWLPQAEPFVLPGASHGLQMMNPAGMTEALTAFFARHPLPVAA